MGHNPGSPILLDSSEESIEADSRRGMFTPVDAQEGEGAHKLVGHDLEGKR